MVSSIFSQLISVIHSVVVILLDSTKSNATLLVFGSIIRGSSLNANYHIDELCGSQITSVIYYITVLL